MEPIVNESRIPSAAGLLIEAGLVLSSSLDVETTMRQIAQLTVPTLGDLCVIDIRNRDGSVRDVAVVAADEALADELALLRRLHPLSLDSEHPAAVAMRSHEGVLIGDLTPALLTSFAQSSEHARFMLEHDYRSVIVAPLVARSRTLGSISLLRLGSGVAYAEQELELLLELARRAALAIDNARLYSELRSVERRLEAILSGIAEAITVVDAHGRTVYANRATADLLGLDEPEELTGSDPGTLWQRFLVTDEHGRELSLDEMPARRLFRGEHPGPLLVRNVVRATGEERWLVVRSSPLNDPDTDELAYAVNVFENITGLKRAQLAESFIAEVSRVLASSMDYAETLQRVAELAVPKLADWCAVDLLSERGEIKRVAVHHLDPERLTLARELAATYSVSADEPLGVPEVIRNGEPRLYNDIDPQALADYARDAAHLRLLSEVGATSVAIVPLVGHTRTLGAITLVSAESGRRLTEADISVAVRLGRRAGAAVENARHYTERKHIADALQAALLPVALPDVPGAQVAARYHAAGTLNEVGGDFYDVLPYGPDGWLLMMGDVCGKGANAASSTAMARHTLRAGAMNHRSLTHMLNMLHQGLAAQQPGADVCTVCLVELQPDRRTLRIALAGHPPPLLIDATGRCSHIGTSGTLLGAIEPIVIEEQEVQIAPGDTLLLYTDGLSEASRLDGDGLEQIDALLTHAPLPQLLDAIERLARERSGGELRDDLALLGLRLS